MDYTMALEALLASPNRFPYSVAKRYALSVESPLR
jgi:hypothetical protein